MSKPPKNIKYVIYAILCLGVCLHIFTALVNSTGGITSFSIGELIWSIVPYIICLIILRSVGTPIKALGASLLILIMDAWIYVNVFITPSSSTAAIGLIIMPFWNMVLVIPIGCLLGWLIEKYFKIESTKKT
jgi:hypothetical protein